MMNIKLAKRSADEAVLSLEGRLDTNSATATQQALEKVCGEYRSVILNFAQLEYISSAGLRVLLSVQKKVNVAGGRLALTAMRPAVQEVFEMTGFSGILKII